MYGFGLDLKNWWWYIIFLITPFVGQFALHHQNNEKPVFWFFNVIGWFLKPDPSSRASPTCDIIPGGTDLGYLENMPSKWITHIVFFFGFIFSNTYAIFNEPAPTITDDNSPERESRQAILDQRVANRKTIAIGVIVSASFFLLRLLSIRFATTPCESGFLYSLIPMVLIGLTGAAWFNILYKSCGVRPADVLGIVPGMISPNMADNPIVCVGS
jgi:hypothetical protein